MKLDYLPEGSPDCPLIRLYEFTPAEAEQLRASVAALASGSNRRLEVHSLPGVEVVGRCRLTFTALTWNAGVVCKAPPVDFECGLTAGTWDNVAGLIEPFCQSGGGFQWLFGTPGECSLLLSCNGQW
jgi:hypothetical protein